MNEQNKKLVFRYLSMALPYNVIVDRLGNVKPLESCKITKNGTMVVETSNHPYTSNTYLVEEVKPYLREISSMTEDEKKELMEVIKEETNMIIEQMKNNDCGVMEGKYHHNHILTLDWLLKKKFDFMELIPNGLALKVTKENNPYEIRD